MSCLQGVKLLSLIRRFPLLKKINEEIKECDHRKIYLRFRQTDSQIDPNVTTTAQLMQSSSSPSDNSGLIGDTLHCWGFIDWVSMEMPTVLSKLSTKGPGENKSCTATLYCKVVWQKSTKLWNKKQLEVCELYSDQTLLNKPKLTNLKKKKASCEKFWLKSYLCYISLK